MLRKLDPAATPPETSRPAPEKVVSGDPVHTTWNLHEQGGYIAASGNQPLARGGCAMTNGNM
jgi:uncharacterized cupin superfamily protein